MCVGEFHSTSILYSVSLPTVYVYIYQHCVYIYIGTIYTQKDVIIHKLTLAFPRHFAEAKKTDPPPLTGRYL